MHKYSPPSGHGGFIPRFYLSRHEKLYSLPEPPTHYYKVFAPLMLSLPLRTCKDALSSFEKSILNPALYHNRMCSALTPPPPYIAMK